MSTVQASPTQHRCSCGRTFLNAISLERHIWVTKHEAAAAQSSIGTQGARDRNRTMAQALKVLREKQAMQLEFDIKRRQKRRMHREIRKVEQHVYGLAEQAYEGAKSVGRSGLAALRLALMVMMLSGIVVVGMKIGTLIPS